MSFDRVAPYYDSLARLVFGNSIQQAQYHFLDQIPPAARVLVVGGGTGWILPYLLERPEVVHITFLENSARMLTLAQQTMGSFHKPSTASVIFVHGDEHSLTESDRFSVVITNFVLDMYQGSALDNLVQTLTDHLSPRGVWLFTDFRLSEQKKHRWWQRIVAQTMYAFFHLTAGIARHPLPPYHQCFTSKNFRMVLERSFFSDFIVSRVYLLVE